MDDEENPNRILDYGTDCVQDDCDGKAYIFATFEQGVVYKCKKCDYEWSET